MSAKSKNLGSWWLALLFSVASLMAADNEIPLVEAGLVEAAKQGDREAVRSLLQEHADVNAAQADGATALAWAAYRDDLETADLLIRAGADLNAANDYGVSPLSLACTNRNAAMVEKLLEAGADPTAAQWTGETPLMTCSSTGAVEAVKSLLAHGADVNAAETQEGQTALMWAAAEKHPEIVQALVEHGADIHTRSKVIPLPEPFLIETPGPLGFNHPTTVHFPKTKGGFTPLLFAAQQGDVDSARTLLGAGADVKEATPENGSVLVVATASGHEELAVFLLEQGADPNATDGFGISAMHYALHEGLLTLMGAKRSSTDRFGWLRPNMPELVKTLLAHGADPNARIGKNFPTLDDPFLGRSTEDPPQMDPVGATPFMLAAASGDIEAMRILVEGRADPRATTLGGVTPLMVAAGMGTELRKREEKSALEATKLAVGLGGDVNAPIDDDGRTPLHAAAYLGWNEMIRFLAEQGANLDAKDKYGQTPLSIALGDPEGLVYRQITGGRYDDRFRRPREHKKTAELLVHLGATPFTGKVRDRSGE